MWWEVPVRAIERSRRASRVGQTLGHAFGRVVRPGPVKDLLSGTPFGHPLHPILTDVPIGAWTSAIVLDLVPGEATDRGATILTGVGLAAAVPTAITGLSELSDVTAPEERSVGAVHAVSNVIATAFFAASFVNRIRGRQRRGKVLALLGATIAGGSAHLGGHLVYERGVGVSHTAFAPPIDEWTRALDERALEPERPLRATVRGVDVMLYRDASGIHAIANECTHRGGPLHKGRVEDGCVTCPWHRSVFRLDTGDIQRGPASAPAPVYDVRVVDGVIEIKLRRREERTVRVDTEISVPSDGRRGL